jgi:hypothetical protein
VDADGTFRFERGYLDGASLQRGLDRLLGGGRCAAATERLLDLDLDWVDVAVREEGRPGVLAVLVAAPALGGLTGETAEVLLVEILLPALIDELGEGCLGARCDEPAGRLRAQRPPPGASAVA